MTAITAMKIMELILNFFIRYATRSRSDLRVAKLAIISEVSATRCQDLRLNKGSSKTK